MVITLAFHAGNRGSSPLFGRMNSYFAYFCFILLNLIWGIFPITVVVNNGETEITADIDFQLTSFPTPRTIFVLVRTGESESWCKLVSGFDGIKVGSFSLLVLPNPDLSAIGISTKLDKSALFSWTSVSRESDTLSPDRIEYVCWMVQCQFSTQF